MPIELNTLFYCKYLEIGALHFRSKENKRKTFRANLIVFQLNFSKHFESKNLDGDGLKSEEMFLILSHRQLTYIIFLMTHFQ